MQGINLEEAIFGGRSVNKVFLKGKYSSIFTCSFMGYLVLFLAVHGAVKSDYTCNSD